MKLLRFPYSPFVLKVQCLLGLAGVRFAVEDVPYGDRSGLVAVTGGYIHVPVLVDDAGVAHVDSRVISELVVSRFAPSLVPSPLEGPIWAYADWADQVLEDPCFKLAVPGILRRFQRPVDRALYTLIKERKYGAGCVQGWERSATQLLEQSRAALAPSDRTLSARPFLFGDRPTLADAALWGQLGMLRYAGIAPSALGEALPAFVGRLEEASGVRG